MVVFGVFFPSLGDELRCVCFLLYFLLSGMTLRGCMDGWEGAATIGGVLIMSLLLGGGGLYLQCKLIMT